MKTLIIYYSLEGNTKLIADTIAKTLESSPASGTADTIRLEPVKDIKPTGVMRYMRGGKQVVMKETPEIRYFVSLSVLLCKGAVTKGLRISGYSPAKLERSPNGQRDFYGTVDPNDYDLIIMGTPVRAFNYVPAFRTFFQDRKIEHKKIALFCTHEGGPGKTLNNMKDCLPNNDIIATKDFLNVAKDTKKSVKDATQRAKEIEF